MHNLAADMIESDAAFRSQFDRSSAEFHGGDSRPIPVGGNRVPESMKAHADWESLPIVESAPVDIGPVATRLMEVRTLIGDLKKALETVCKPIDLILRIKADPVPEDAEEAKIAAIKQEKEIAGEKQKKEDCIKAIEEFIEKFHDDEKRQQFIKGVVEQAKIEYEDRDSYGNFLLEMKRQQSLLFIEQKNILQDIKKAKQAYIASQKEASA